MNINSNTIELEDILATGSITEIRETIKYHLDNTDDGFDRLFTAFEEICSTLNKRSDLRTSTTVPTAESIEQSQGYKDLVTALNNTEDRDERDVAFIKWIIGQTVEWSVLTTDTWDKLGTTLDAWVDKLTTRYRLCGKF